MYKVKRKTDGREYALKKVSRTEQSEGEWQFEKFKCDRIYSYFSDLMAIE